MSLLCSVHVDNTQEAVLINDGAMQLVWAKAIPYEEKREAENAASMRRKMRQFYDEERSNQHWAHLEMFVESRCTTQANLLLHVYYA